MKEKIALPSATNKKINFLRGEKIHVGIDVHKNTFSVNVWSEKRGASIKQWTQSSDGQALIQALKPFKRRIENIVYEAGPTGFNLVRALRESGFPADVIAPSRTPKSTGQETKCDRIDARRLAMWSAKGLLTSVYVPSAREEADRQLFRTREEIQRKRRRVMQQIKSFLLRYGVPEPKGLQSWSRASVQSLRELTLASPLRFGLDRLLDDYEHYEKQKNIATKEIEASARSKRRENRIEALRTVPGVGLLTAFAFAVEIPSPQRFDNRRELTAFLGLAPMVSRSGETVREGSLIKCGNTRLRTILIEAAWAWHARDPWARERYGQYVRSTGNGKKAICALARRLAVVLWRIAVTGEAYRPKPNPTTS